MKLSKKEQYIEDLSRYTLDNKEFISYLLGHSNLPGKRGNLELAFTFAEYIEKQYPIYPIPTLNFCEALITENPPSRRITGSEEFLPFCGVLGLGRIGKIDPSKEPEILVRLKSSAQDERWRIREAVAMALQDFMDARPEATFDILRSWINEDSYLLYRAVAAGIAEPRLMKEQVIAHIALELHKAILGKVVRESDRRNSDYNILVKGLCYTLSVVIVGIEREGFAYLNDLLDMNHPIVNKIVRENLKKKRLIRLNAKNVADLQQKMEKTV